MDDDGNAVVVWYQYEGSYNNIYANIYSNGAWGTATLLENADYNALYPHIAMDHDGNAIVVWNQRNGPSYSIYASVYSDGEWGTATLLENGDDDALYPQIAMDDNGNAIAVWRQYDGSYWNIYATIYRAEVDVTIDFPVSGSTGYSSTILVSGTTTPGLSLNVNGYVTSADDDGHFSAVIPLLEGTNTITVTATNENWGTSDSASITVDYVDQMQDDLDAANDEIDDLKANSLPLMIGVLALVIAIIALLLFAVQFLKGRGK